MTKGESVAEVMSGVGVEVLLDDTKGKKKPPPNVHVDSVPKDAATRVVYVLDNETTLNQKAGLGVQMSLRMLVTRTKGSGAGDADPDKERTLLLNDVVASQPKAVTATGKDVSSPPLSSFSSGSGAGDADPDKERTLLLNDVVASQPKAVTATGKDISSPPLSSFSSGSGAGDADPDKERTLLLNDVVASQPKAVTATGKDVSSPPLSSFSPGSGAGDADPDKERTLLLNDVVASQPKAVTATGKDVSSPPLSSFSSGSGAGDADPDKERTLLLNDVVASQPKAVTATGKDVSSPPLSSFSSGSGAGGCGPRQGMHASTQRRRCQPAQGRHCYRQRRIISTSLILLLPAPELGMRTPTRNARFYSTTSLPASPRPSLLPAKTYHLHLSHPSPSGSGAGDADPDKERTLLLNDVVASQPKAVTATGKDVSSPPLSSFSFRLRSWGCGPRQGTHASTQRRRCQPAQGRHCNRQRRIISTSLILLLPHPNQLSLQKKPANMISCLVTHKAGKAVDHSAGIKGTFRNLLGTKKTSDDKIFPIAIPPGGSVELGLQVWLLMGCSVNLPLHLELEVAESSEVTEEGGETKTCIPATAFTLLHRLRLETESALALELGPVSPFEPPSARRSRLRFERKAVKGAVLPRDDRNQMDKKVALPMFPVPMAVRVLAASRLQVPVDSNHSEDLIQTMKGLRDLLDDDLTEVNYVSRFSFLLHLNELEQQGFLETYTMDSGVQLAARPDDHGSLETNFIYELSVPGLAEGRPKIVVGDPIYLTLGRNKRRYEGVVRGLGAPSTVAIGMSKQFETDFRPTVDTCKVEFGMCRVPVRMQQRALLHASAIMPCLFPNKVEKGGAVKPEKEFDFLNSKVERNPEQRQAVEQIVAGKHHPAPYIVFGPPGTGKTVTLVEAISQVVKQNPDARVLACATSNAAVDLLANRLLHYLPSDKLMRLNACSRSLYTMDQETQVFKISPASEDHFIIPPAEEVAAKSVILSTLCNAGQLANAGFGGNFLTAVFVDEAGQGCEPETLVALGGVAGPKTRLVLAGDPHQLGPVLYSRDAAKAGLAVPLMERLMRDFDCYAKEGHLDHSLDASVNAYNPRLISKLVRNYRSHEALLTVPSNLFYADELIPSADMSKETLQHWVGLPAKNIPLIVHGVVGTEMREARSPSYFNPLEMCVVKSYVDQLLGAADHHVKDKHIGIIAPYHQQVRKTKQMLSKDLGKYGNLCVGSVEEFQGAERRILILTTVRSSPDCLLELKEEEKAEAANKSKSRNPLGGIGFLANPKRFNTAVTRAKALLIVIGNPYVLQKDMYWRRLLSFALEKNAYRGVAFALDSKTEMETSSDAVSSSLSDPQPTEPSPDKPSS